MPVILWNGLQGRAATTSVLCNRCSGVPRTARRVDTFSCLHTKTHTTYDSSWCERLQPSGRSIAILNAQISTEIHIIQNAFSLSTSYWSLQPVMQDVCKPDSTRLRRNLSALINFAKFREEKLAVYVEMQERTIGLMESADQRQEINEHLVSISALMPFSVHLTVYWKSSPWHSKVRERPQEVTGSMPGWSWLRCFLRSFGSHQVRVSIDICTVMETWGTSLYFQSDSLCLCAERRAGKSPISKGCRSTGAIILLTTVNTNRP